MMMMMKDYSYMPDDKTKALTDNEIPDGINSVVLKESRHFRDNMPKLESIPVYLIFYLTVLTTFGTRLLIQRLLNKN